MKKRIDSYKGIKKKFSAFQILNTFAMLLAVDSVNTCCIWIHHQPKVPKEMDQYIKCK